ncbi:LysR family transcriptional regulator [Pseudomonas amygdali]|uniref:LysR family transcriptional regulator n=4 Tax=Pseudomonas amygdali TaxID=47877 RepID=UPI003967277B
MRPVNFDLDVMRSFVTGVELGSFAKAAQKLARSTSAISAQLKKLEAQAGSPLFKKAGRKLALTDTGEVLLKEALIYSIFRPCNALEALIYQGATAGF